MADHDYKIGGLRQKYHITKTSGEPVDESAVYYVLRVDVDPHARKALLAYANSIAGENEILASEPLAKLSNGKRSNLIKAPDKPVF